MSYEIEDWHDLGDFARSRYLQPDEESDMPDLNAKEFTADGKQRNGGVPCEGNGQRLLPESPSPFQRFSEWKKNYVEPKFTNGSEQLVEERGVVFFDLPPIPKPRLVADTNWESVDASRRESVERLDRQQRGRIFAGVFWGVMVVAGAVALTAGAVQAVQMFYKAILP